MLLGCTSSRLIARAFVAFFLVINIVSPRPHLQTLSRA